MQKAVDLAKSSDGVLLSFRFPAFVDRKIVVTIVVVGNNNEWESEGYDRSDMK